MRTIHALSKSSFRFVAFLLVAALFLTMSGLASAQDQSQDQAPGQAPDQTQGDPPGRVARLNYMTGSVSFEPAGTTDWVDANPNRPLTTGDSLWADENSRGELHVDSTAIRISSSTGLSFLNLDDQTAQIQLAQGSLDIRVRDMSDTDAYEIDTPNLAFTILRPGEYRVDVDPNGTSTMITVRSGNGEVTTGERPYNLNPGQQYAFSGSNQLTYDAHAAPGKDAFENWCSIRDIAEDRSQSAQYVSRDVIGYQDLDANGTWHTDPDYGSVWVPSGVSADWAPYHNGHWVFVAPWGWTWVEDEPWGFAPFHYGRWAIVGGVWGWAPGPAVGLHVGVAIGGPVIRPMYAPALVGFVGGGGFSMSITIGGGAGVAWFPLGPRDVWVPGYHASAAYVQNVNISNTRVVSVTQVTNVYRNVTVEKNVTVNNYTYSNNVRAVTAVNRDTFVGGRSVAKASITVTPDQIQHPQVMQNASLQPTHASRVGPSAAARTMPPAALANRPVVTKLAPSPRATPIGRTQPLANSKPGPSAAPSQQNGQPNRPAGQQGFQSFQPPARTNQNPNQTTNPNAITNRNNNGNGANPNNGANPPNGANRNEGMNRNDGAIRNDGANPNSSTAPNRVAPNNATTPNNGANRNDATNPNNGLNRNNTSQPNARPAARPEDSNAPARTPADNPKPAFTRPDNSTPSTHAAPENPKPSTSRPDDSANQPRPSEDRPKPQTVKPEDQASKPAPRENPKSDNKDNKDKDKDKKKDKDKDSN